MISHRARLFLLIVCSLTSSVLAAEPTSQPIQQIQKWFDQLADSDSDVRGQAIESLMAMSAQDLPRLQDVVRAARSILPSQRTALREIVSHVYLSDLPYDPDVNGAAFMGMGAESNVVGTAPLPPDAPPGAVAQPMYDGIIVTRRIPGFPAYRILRDGDVIKRLKESPEARFDDMPHFIDAMRSFMPGQSVTLVVVRDGKELTLPVPLRPRPAAIEFGDTWTADRQSMADEYWERIFQPLMQEEVAPAL